LGDFGFAIEETRLNEARFNLGSPLYMSLEALERSEYSFASDVFAFGVVLYEMLHRESPWECVEEAELIARMRSEQPVVRSGVSEGLRELILSCLRLVPGERPTIDQIMVHPALNPPVPT
jgi:serine/threonine protein kinase